MARYRTYIINYEKYVVFTEGEKVYTRRLYWSNKGWYIRFNNEKRLVDVKDIYR